MKKIDPLPNTRREQLFYLLKTRWTDIVFSSIYLFIFFVPCLLWMMLFSRNVDNNIYNILTMYGVMIPLIMVFGLGVGGVLYSFKRMCYSEGANIHRDLFTGIKKNAKDFLVLYFFIGLLYFLFHTALSIVTSSNLNNNVISVIQGLLIVSYIILLISLYFTQSQMVFYTGGFIKLSINSIKFTFGLIIKNLGMILLTLLPFFIFEFIEFVPNQNVVNITRWICIGVSGMFYFGFNLLMFLEYSISIFDESINKKQYPDLVRKGLLKEEKEEIDLSSI